MRQNSTVNQSWQAIVDMMIAVFPPQPYSRMCEKYLMDGNAAAFSSRFFVTFMFLSIMEALPKKTNEWTRIIYIYAWY